MPTLLPPVRLTLRQGARVACLLLRARWLAWSMKRAKGDELLRVAKLWVRCHDEVGVVLGMPEPPAVTNVRALLDALPGGTGQGRGRIVEAGRQACQNLLITAAGLVLLSLEGL